MDKKSTASFDVDAQKGFTPLCPQELPVPGGDTIVDALNSQAELAGLRVGSKDWHPLTAIWLADQDNPQFSVVEGENVDIRWNSHCMAGTKGAELLDGLPHPNHYDFFVYKGLEADMHPYGACFHDLAERQSTGVIEFLQSRHIRTVLVGGLATDYCVKNSALQLKRYGDFEVIVNLSGCRGVAADSTELAIQAMKTAGIRVVKAL